MGKKYKWSKTERKARERLEKRQRMYNFKILPDGTLLFNDPKVGKVSRKKRKRRKFVPYTVYLRSGWWRGRRRRKLASVGGKCERCGRPASQVHHRHYRTLWREKDSDLEALCRSCHEAEHECWIAANRHLDEISSES